MITVVPKFMSIEDYGAWQLFLFYFSYVGFLHFGWIDGIYLRYAGCNYASLDRKMFSGQIYGIILLQIILGITIFYMAKIFTLSIVQTKIIGFIGIAMVFSNFNNCCNFIFQITNRISYYAKMVVVEQLVLLSFVGFTLFIGLNSYINLIYCKIAALFISACFACFGIKELMHFTSFDINAFLQEAWENISVGSKLLLANIASILIIGIFRYGISANWDIATFGKISLTLSISNFILAFINAGSIVFFPLLKKVKEENLGRLYTQSKSFLSIFLLGLLFLYYPVRQFLSLWLPQYASSLIYMAILFPLCFFESKMALLINTYLKSMRQESLMLKINICTLIFSILFTYIGASVIHNLNWLVLFILLLVAFRCVLAEFWVEKLLHINIKTYNFIDICVIIIFVSCNWFMDNYIGFIIYFSVYFLYLYFNKNKIIQLLSYIRKLKQ
jgi:hypothetical protein